MLLDASRWFRTDIMAMATKINIRTYLAIALPLLLFSQHAAMFRFLSEDKPDQVKPFLLFPTLSFIVSPILLLEQGFLSRYRNFGIILSAIVYHPYDSDQYIRQDEDNNLQAIDNPYIMMQE